MTSRPEDVAVADERPGLVGAFLSIFGLTMTNPMTILSFAAIFAGLGLVGRGGADAALLTLGVFCGSMSWWLVLTSVVSALRTRVTVRGLTWVNRVSGVVLLGFAIVSIASAFGRLSVYDSADGRPPTLDAGEPAPRDRRDRSDRGARRREVPARRHARRRGAA